MEVFITLVTTVSSVCRRFMLLNDWLMDTVEPRSATSGQGKQHVPFAKVKRYQIRQRQAIRLARTIEPISVLGCNHSLAYDRYVRYNRFIHDVHSYIYDHSSKQVQVFSTTQLRCLVWNLNLSDRFEKEVDRITYVFGSVIIGKYQQIWI